MKKILSGIVFALVLFTGMELQAQWVDKVTLYVPNRILDLLDVFSLDIGGGPAARAELRLTHAVQGGGGFGGILPGPQGQGGDGPAGEDYFCGGGAVGKADGHAPQLIAEGQDRFTARNRGGGHGTTPDVLPGSGILDQHGGISESGGADLRPSERRTGLLGNRRNIRAGADRSQSVHSSGRYSGRGSGILLH